MPQQDDKLFKDKKEFGRWIIFVAFVLILIYFAISRIDIVAMVVNRAAKVLQPFIMGFVMAFLMNPMMKFFEKRLSEPFRKVCKTDSNAKHSARILSSILALVILVGICVLFSFAIIPELISTIQYLVDHLQEQIAAVLDWSNEITGGRYEASIMSAKDSDASVLLNQGIDLVKDYMDFGEKELPSLITSSVMSIGKILFNLIIGMFVSVYVLIDKEKFKGQSKKLIYSIFKPKQANEVLEITRKASDVFYGFIIGKILDSIIIGIICYVFMLIADMPYMLLCSVIIGVTNIIPVFGPYIGAIPTVIIIFLTEPWKGIGFLIFVLILQQVDGNLIGPKILGDSIGISSFWVIVGVVVGGGLFGVPGMIIGVPTLAVIYSVIGMITSKRLGKKGLTSNTFDFVRLIRVNPETNEMEMRSKEEEEAKRQKIFPGRGHKKH